MTMELQVPTEQEWENYESDLDSRYAYKQFFGKSVDQAMHRFESSPINGVEELSFMAPIPFRYYTLSLCKYLLSPAIIDNPTASDAASSFLNLIREKAQSNPQILVPIWDSLVPVFKYLSENQELYDADIEIYGSFNEKVVEILKLIKG